MSYYYERNKTDLERAIEKAKEVIGQMEGIVTRDILDVIADVFAQYDHLKSDIEEMASLNQEET